jgi:uncharacterized protein HemY
MKALLLLLAVLVAGVLIGRATVTKKPDDV